MLSCRKRWFRSRRVITTAMNAVRARAGGDIDESLQTSKPQRNRFRLKYQSTATIEASMSALAYHKPCGLLLQGRCRFMPKKPLISTNGTAMVSQILRHFIAWFVVLATAER